MTAATTSTARARRPAHLSPRLTAATAGRVLRQLRHDHRTIAMMLVLPSAAARAALPAVEGPADPPRPAGHLRPGRADHARHLPVRGDVPGHQHRDAPRAHLRARSSGCSPRRWPGWTCCSATAPRSGSPPPRRPLVTVADRDDGLRPRRRRLDLAGRPHRRRRRGARRGARAAGQRVRPHRVPGRAVHAGDRAAAVLPLRAARAASTRWPGWLQAISNLLPLTYAVEALQEVGQLGRRPPARCGSTSASSPAPRCWPSALAAATLRRRTN